jgi:hypothetical protein
VTLRARYGNHLNRRQGSDRIAADARNGGHVGRVMGRIPTIKDGFLTRTGIGQNDMQRACIAHAGHWPMLAVSDQIGQVHAALTGQCRAHARSAVTRTPVHLGINCGEIVGDNLVNHQIGWAVACIGSQLQGTAAIALGAHKTGDRNHIGRMLLIVPSIVGLFLPGGGAVEHQGIIGLRFGLNHTGPKHDRQQHHQPMNHGSHVPLLSRLDRGGLVRPGYSPAPGECDDAPAP